MLSAKRRSKGDVIADIIIYVFIVVVMICLVLLYFKRREDTETIKEIKETVVPKEIEIVDDSFHARYDAVYTTMCNH